MTIGGEERRGEGANGGFDGSDGLILEGGAAGGIGQRTTTREFGEANGVLYAEGGGGYHSKTTALRGGGGWGTGSYTLNGKGVPSTGGGGYGGYTLDGSDYIAEAGGSGIVIIRNSR